MLQAVLACCLALSALSANIPGRQIHLFGVDDSVPCEGLRASTRDAEPGEEAQWLVHYSPPATKELRTSLIEIFGKIRYVPDDTFVVYSTRENVERAKTLSKVTWIGQRPAASKFLSHQLRQMACNATASPSAGVSSKKTSLRKRVDKSKVTDLGKVYWIGIRDEYSENVKEWERGLGQHLGEEGTYMIHEASKNKLVLRVTDASAGRALQWLAAHSMVEFLEEKPEYKIKNIFARGLIQGNPAGGGSAGPFPVWDSGLTGRGQIVGVGDTGLDARLCYFADENVPLPENEIDQSHRKIVMYRHYAADGDLEDANGHGTHVCGSVAGNAVASDVALQKNMSQFNGMAPDAKIAFTDIEGPSGGLALPDDLSEEYFQDPYDAGARIHTNSWGDSSPSYTSNAMEVDTFVHKNRDFLILFAAGNDGPGPYSVGSPATCKNCLSVGAAMSSTESFLKKKTETLLLALNTPSGSSTFRVYESDFDSAVPRPSPPLSGKYVLSDPRDACSYVYNKKYIKGKIAVVFRGSCTFESKVLRLQKKGAVGVVVINSEDASLPSKMGDDLKISNITIPAVLASFSVGQALLSALDDFDGNTTVTFPIVGDTREYYNSDNLAGFSSHGPTFDGRIKPDLVAPGHAIFSAKRSKNNESLCTPFELPDSSITPLSGTSMAAPVTAGGIALVRQFFTEHNYPGISNPSSALLRATVLAGTVPLTGTYEVDGEAVAISGDVPNNEQGFGHLKLDSILKKNGVSELTVFDEHNSADFDTGDEKIYNFKCSGPVKIVLAWTDPPALPYSRRALVNDLNLAVVFGGETLIGNSPTISIGPDFENLREYHILDDRNNVEMVSFVAGGGGEEIGIRVSAEDVRSGPQPFALAVSGICGSNLTYVSVPDIKLHCNESYAGPFCNIPIQKMELITNETDDTIMYAGASLGAGFPSWTYYTFELALPDLGFAFSADVSAGIVSIFIKKDALPSSYDFDKKIYLDETFYTSNFYVNTSATSGKYYVGVVSLAEGSCAWKLGINYLTCDEQIYYDGVEAPPRDDCGVCFGNNSTCAGCDGVPNSDKAWDACGVCGGDGASCLGCDGVLNSGVTVDACGVCGGLGECKCATPGDCVSTALHFTVSVPPWSFEISKFVRRLATLAAVNIMQISIDEINMDFSVLSVAISLRVRGPTTDPMDVKPSLARVEAAIPLIKASLEASAVDYYKQASNTTASIGSVVSGSDKAPWELLLLISITLILALLLIGLSVLYMQMHRNISAKAKHFSTGL